MASEALDKAGLHFDDLNRIRVLDEDTSSQAQELKDVCQDFLGDIGDFQVENYDGRLITMTIFVFLENCGQLHCDIRYGVEGG